MLIHVGSENPNKVNAVDSVLGCYEMFKGFEINCVSVDSKVGSQPIGWTEIMRGAANRAIGAYEIEGRESDYSFGIEDGVVEIVQGILWNVSVCSVWDGKRSFPPGLGTGFVVPVPAAKLILREKLDLAQALNEAEITDDKDIGRHQGIISILTQGNFTRKMRSESAVHMALGPLLHPEWYS